MNIQELKEKLRKVITEAENLGIENATNRRQEIYFGY